MGGVGGADPWLILGRGRKSRAIFRNSKEKKKSWKNQDPSEWSQGFFLPLEWRTAPLFCLTGVSGAKRRMLFLSSSSASGFRNSQGR